MDNKVIEVLDYMGEKLGIAIDWTSENVMPQVMEFLGRYQVYAIVKAAIWIIIGIIFITAICVPFKSMFNAIKKKDYDSIWFDRYGPNLSSVLLVMLGGCAFVFFTICIICNIFDIITWTFVPEMKFFETLTAYLNNVN